MASIPEGFAEAVGSKLGLTDDILIFTSADRDPRGGFKDTFFAATKSELIIAEGGQVTKKAFRGFVNKMRLKEIDNKPDFFKCEFTRIPLEQIDSLQVIGLVAGGRLTYIKDNEQVALCAFTNARSKDIGSFVMLFNKLKNKGEITPEDLKQVSSKEACPKCGMLYPDPSSPICPNCSKKSTMILRILKIAKPFRLIMAVVYILTIASAGIGLITPIISGEMLYDGALTQGSELYGQVGYVLMLLAGMYLIQLALNVVSGLLNVRFSAKLIYTIKNMVYKSMQKLSLSFFMDKQTGTLMTRINSDASGMHYFFVDGLTYIVTNAIIVIGATVIMLIKDWQLMLLCYIPVLIVIFYMRRKFKTLGKLNWRRFRRRSTLNSMISDSVKGTRVVKAFGREESEINRFARVNSNFRDTEISFNKQLFTLLPINSLIINLGSVIIWAFGGAQIIGGVIQYGLLMTFINYIAMIYGPMSAFGDFINWWAECATSAQRIFEIMDAPVEVSEPEHPKDKEKMTGNISVKGVSFGYDPNKFVLKNISFDIKAGTMVGIVGHSGAGKSTLVNLISRFYDVNEGEITIDGENVKDYSFKYLRENIGIVSQDVYIFIGTVAENIAYAKPGCDFEEVVRAAKIANAHDFIEKLPDGYDTVIGPGGQDLSGGEKQRLSIARAILHDPKILILDEATASLDTETERQIQEGLETLIEGRTTIAIAHRLSTLRNADYIVVIDNGEIVEQGLHNDLLQNKGEYFRQVQKQTEALRVTGV